MNLKNIKNIKLISDTSDLDYVLFLGDYENDKVILQVKKRKQTFQLSDLTDIKLTMNNDRFYKFFATQSVNTVYDVLAVYPAQEEDYKKYLSKKKRILETPNIYYKTTYPRIVHQDLTWIDNIMNGKKESDNIIYNDEDFILMPDLKWSTGDLCDMYYLAIFKDKELRSIRSLNQSHLSLLNKVKEISTNKIKELHNINDDQLRLYFHYHPTFWQLHLHINLITKSWHGALSDCAHLLPTVINNIELVNDYYQRANIEIGTNKD